MILPETYNHPVRRMRLSALILLCLLSLTPALYSQGEDLAGDSAMAIPKYYTYSKVTKQVLTGPQLMTPNPFVDLTISSDPAQLTCTKPCNKKTYLKVSFHVGGNNREYKFGRVPAINLNVNFKIEVITPPYPWTNYPISYPPGSAISNHFLSINTGATIPQEDLVIDITGIRLVPDRCPEVPQALPLPNSVPAWQIPPPPGMFGPIRLTVLGFGPPPPPPVMPEVRLEFTLIEEWAVDVRTIGVGCSEANRWLVPKPVLGINPLTFQWENKVGCALDTFPNYQLQLLRLFNTDSANKNKEGKIKAQIDWNKALTLETYGPKQEMILTVPEGTGFYAWRVRPIGDRYENGIGNDSNWGCWTKSPAQDDIVNLDLDNPPPPGPNDWDSQGIFFYEQFDDTLNWIFNRKFTEGLESRPGISEGITFANGLMQSRQKQAHIQTNDSVLASGTVYDFSGRPSLQSMAAPVQQGKLEYIPMLLRSSADIYTAVHFDTDGNYRNPNAMQTGPVSDYYSDMNPDLSIPAADRLPYSRTFYYPDAVSKVQEQTAPGSTFSVGAGRGEKTVKTYYSGVIDKELVSVFGDEAPADSSVTKIIQTDQNGISSIQYISKEGQVIATCLAKQGDHSSLMGINDPVNYIAFIDTVRSDQQLDEYVFSAQKKITVLDSTREFKFNYSFTPQAFQALCENYCATCDYRIIRTIRRISPDQTTIFGDVTSINDIVDCMTPGTISKPELILNLSPGEYIVERTVYSNNPDTTTINGNTVIRTKLEKHIDSVRSKFAGKVRTQLSTIFGAGPLSRFYQDSSRSPKLYDTLLANYASFYQALGGNHTIAVDSCCEVQLPPSPCRVTCSPSDFEDFLYTTVDATVLGTLDPGVNYLPLNLNNYFKTTDAAAAVIDKYPGGTVTGMFNNLITNMTANGYRCEDLWNCWENTVIQYKNLAYEKVPGDTTGAKQRRREFDLLETFLNCAGRKFCAISDVPYGTTGYLENAWKYYKFDTTSANDTGCALSLGFDRRDTTDSLWFCGVGQSDSAVHYNHYRLYQCIHANDAIKSLIVNESQSKIDAERTKNNKPSCIKQNGDIDFDCIVASIKRDVDTCKTVCEGRRQSFLDSMVTTYNRAGYHVEGYLDRPVTQPLKNETIPYVTLMCMAEGLVQNCFEYCDITIFKHFDQAKNDTLLDSIGTAEQIENNLKVRLYQFELSLTDLAGNCPNDYEKLEKYVPIGTLAVNILNSELKKFRDTLSREKGLWNYKDVWRTLRLSYPSLGLCNDTMNMVVPVQRSRSSEFYYREEEEKTGKFSVTRYKIYYRQTGLQNKEYSQDSTHQFVAFLNNYLDRTWAKRVKATDFIFNDSANTSHRNSGNHYAWYAGALLEAKDPLYWYWKYCQPGCHETGDSVYCDYSFLCMNGQVRTNANIFLGITGRTGHAFRVTRGNAWDDSLAVSGPVKLVFHNPSNYADSMMLVFTLKKGNASGSNLDTISFESTYGAVTVAEKYVTTSSKLELTQFLTGKFSEKVGRFIQGSDGLLRYESLLDQADSSLAIPQISLVCPACDDVIEICQLKGRDSTLCGSVCFRWKDSIFIPEAESIGPKSCAKQAIEYLLPFLEGKLYGDCMTNIINEVKTKYKEKCALPSAFKDVFTVSYGMSFYHYTLYYYDRAGNLMKTVPPKGVAPLQDPNITRANHPAHTMVTEYRRNALKQLVYQNIPDAGITNFWYNAKGQLRLSQNSKQVLNNQYSYTKYDALGRIIEVGQMTNFAGLSGSEQAYADDPNFPQASQGPDNVTRTFYTNQALPLVQYLGKPGVENEQQYLLNRVSYSYRDVDGWENTTNDQVITYYSYDIHGNITWLCQDIPGLGRSFVKYEYDLISGKVRNILYQDNKPDRFYHTYTYDADNRIRKTETSRDKWIWERDAEYSYYAHGPLRRLEHGTDKIQGLDYTYTLQGWLKGINHPALINVFDPGQDGIVNSYANDAFGMVLGYFSGDFVRKYGTSTFSNFNSALTPAQHNLSGSPLYNGNISSWTSNIMSSGTGLTFEQLTGSRYSYDVLNRLRRDDFRTWNGAKWIPTTQYSSLYDYDPNGNIIMLQRNDGVGQIDMMNYNYTNSTNRLDHVVDPVAPGVSMVDIDGQGPANYSYDAIGNLTGNTAEGINPGNITWDVYGKLTSITKTNGTNIQYLHDAAGNRVRKLSTINNIITYTWYVRDAGGNILAIYEKKNKPEAELMPLTLTELHLYGSERVAILRPSQLRNVSDPDTLGKFIRYFDRKEYELKDHLLNVRVTISDLKIPSTTGGFIADLKTYTNTYPYGMLMPNRNYQTVNYRFGFNGQEADNEIYGTGNAFTSEYWEYDPRLGVRWNVDPVTRAWESSYACFADNPIMLNDPNGRSGGDPQKHKTVNGDNLTTISKKYGVSVDNLVKWNSIRDRDKIDIGQELIVSDPTRQAALQKFNTYPNFGLSKGWTTRRENHSSVFESTSASSGLEVGQASMACYDVCNFSGNLLEAVKVDPAMVNFENQLIAQARSNSEFGQYNFYFSGQAVIGFGGQRWSSPNEAWSSVSRRNPLLHKSTWMVAANTLTWVLRNATVKYFVEVNPQGAINIQYRVYDGLDLSPQNGRSEAYNNISAALGLIYHDWGGGNPNLQTRATWSVTR